MSLFITSVANITGFRSVSRGLDLQLTRIRSGRADSTTDLLVSARRNEDRLVVTAAGQGQKAATAGRPGPVLEPTGAVTQPELAGGTPDPVQTVWPGRQRLVGTQAS